MPYLPPAPEPDIHVCHMPSVWPWTRVGRRWQCPVCHRQWVVQWWQDDEDHLIRIWTEDRNRDGQPDEGP